MSVGTTLSVLRTMLKAEVGNVLDSGVNTADDARFTQLLSNKQQELGAVWDWPFERTRLDVAMVPGTRFYTLPGINFDREHTCQVTWNQIWTSLEYGIRETDYNLVDSLTTPPQQNDPVQKWLITSPTQFEVWPVPASVATVRFTGMVAITPLVNDNDTCVLDDLLIVYMCAAEEATLRKQANAPLKIQKANARLQFLKSAGPIRDTVFVVGSRYSTYSHKGRKKVLM